MYEIKLACGVCGGDVTVGADGIGGTCLGCGNGSVYPKADIKTLNRIAYLRNTLKFDAASALAEQLKEEFPEDSECYIAALLCEYGIQYIRDGAKRTPVCRADVSGLTPVKESENYKKALKYAPAEYQQNYEALADALEESFGIASDADKTEEEYEVFVLSAENVTPDDDFDGDRIYLRFKENLGFKVFYAPEMLSDAPVAEKAAKTVAAAKRAKLFIMPFKSKADCTDDYLNYMTGMVASIAAADSDKVIYTVFNSGSVSFQELPEPLVWLDVAFDSADTDFMRELSDEVEKLLKPEAAAIVPDAIVTATAANKENLIKRAYMFLEDGEFDTADTYFDKILDIDIEESRAYIGKLLASCKLKSEDEIPNLPQTVTDDKNFIKALRFASPEQKAHYESLNNVIVERIESEKQRISVERERVKAERAELEELERQRRARQEREERKAQYQRRRDPLRKTLLEVQAELSKTFLSAKRKAELKEQEEILKKNLKELDMLYPDVFD